MARSSFLSAVRRGIREADRAQRRHQRELERERRELARLEAQAEKEAERAAAELEAAEFENRVERLISVHQQSAEPIDWEKVAALPGPQPQPVDTAPRAAAERALAEYQPNSFVRALPLDGIQRDRLERALVQAQEAELQASDAAAEGHEKALADWKQQQALAAAIAELSAGAWDQVVVETGVLEELEELGCNVSTEWFGDLASVAIRVPRGTSFPQKKRRSLRAESSRRRRWLPRRSGLSTRTSCAAARFGSLGSF